MNYKCCLEGKQKSFVNKVTKEEQSDEEIILTVQVPYTSLCPCSKEISDYGAHNQRSFADVKVVLIPNKIFQVKWDKRMREMANLKCSLQKKVRFKLFD